MVATRVANQNIKLHYPVGYFYVNKSVFRTIATMFYTISRVSMFAAISTATIRNQEK